MRLSQSRTMFAITIFIITTGTFVLSDTNVFASTDNGQALVISTTISPTESSSIATDTSIALGLSQLETEVESASVGRDNQTGASLKPEIYSFHIDSDIRYRYSRTYVTSRVVNRDPTKSQEVTFRVVLPETAFISKFIMEIDGKAYEAYVKEKEEAKKLYNQAQSQGQSAGLVELNTRNANVFDVNVNIKAQAKVNFNLTYEELLSRRLGRYEQSISISPDQISNVKDFQIVVTIEESQNITLLRVPNLRNDIEAQEDSEGNNKDAIIERSSGNKAQIKWTPTEKDQNQLAKQEITGKFIVQYDIKRELDAGEVLVMNGYFVHFFAPENLPALRKHIVFVLDTSGSMWGRKMTQLKEAMSKILADLNTEDYFNILTFSSDVTLWSPEDKSPVSANSNWAPPPFHGEPIPTVLSVDPRKRQPYPATFDNIEKAQKFIQSLVASGGTNIQDSIVQALNLTTSIKLARDNEAIINKTVTSSMQVQMQETSTITSTQAPATIATGDNSSTTTTQASIADATEVQVPLIVLPPNVESLIIFLTDGEPTVGATDLSQIQTAIQAANKNISVPLFSLAFGEGADFPFLRKLSLQNNGFARKIYEAADATIQLTGFFNEIASPLLSNITFNYTSPEYSIQNLTLTKFSTVFGGTEIAVAGIIIPKHQPTVEPLEEVTTIQPVGSSELLEEVQIEGSQVAPTEKRYFDVEIGGFGRNGQVHFNNSEVFSSPIPWGIPVIKPFPPRPTPVPTQEDLFLERLWAYLTVQQLIEKDFAKQSQENEIPGESQPTTTVPPSSTVVSTITIGNRTIKISTVVPTETPKQKALRLALKYGFVTSLTSLVVVKPNSSDVTDAVAATANPDTTDSLTVPQSFNHFQAIKPVHKVKFSAGGQGTANRIAGSQIAFPANTAHHQHMTGISSFQSFRPAYAQGNPGFPAFAPYPPVATSTPGLYYSTTVHQQLQQEPEEDIQAGGYTTLPPIMSLTTTAGALSQMAVESTLSSGVRDQEVVSTTAPTQSGSGHHEPTIPADQSNSTAVPMVTVQEESSTQSPTPALDVVTSTSEPDLSPTSTSVSLTLDDLTWVKDIILVNINGTEIAHQIALNATAGDTEGAECGEAQGGRIGRCTHLKDCLIPAILDDYELYIRSYFCSIESRQSDVLYAGTCCATRAKISTKVPRSPYSRTILPASDDALIYNDFTTTKR